MPRERFDKSEIVPKVLEHVRGGGSVQSICTSRDGMPSEATWREWCDKDPVLSSEYARAREARGHHYGERVAELCLKVERGEMPPDAARVAIDGYKWVAGRMTPKVYGDRIAAELSGPDGGPIMLPVSLMLPTEVKREGT